MGKMLFLIHDVITVCSFWIDGVWKVIGFK